MKRVAAIAIINDHHMLMGKRRDNQKFTNPGGHLNPGEDPVKGAVREVKEETGLELDSHLFKHLETRIVKKPDGSKIEVHGFRVDLRHKPSTSMRQDPDAEVHRWQWVKTDSDLEHISENLHVPLKDNVLLTHILKDKPMKKHIRRFWSTARKMGVGDEIKDKLLKEGPQQYMQRKDNEKKASEYIVGGKADGKSDSDFPKDQLRKGMKVEQEHTNNPAMAKEVAKDHLEEFPNYYTALGKMEEGLKKKAFGKGFMAEDKALFLDLDGTVRRTKSGKPCPNHPDDQEVMEGRYDKLWEYKNRGYKIVAVTNQGGIGLGYMTHSQCRDTLKDLDDKLGGVFDKMLFAPHRPDAKHPWTKPNPGMIHAAARDLGIDLKNSVMVGDRDSDKEAANNAGVKFKWSHEFFK